MYLWDSVHVMGPDFLVHGSLYQEWTDRWWKAFTAIFSAHRRSKDARIDKNLGCKIYLGIAKGLTNLHGKSRLMKIAHRDIKATNILLDNDLNAKISDFGLAKLYDWDSTHMVTKVRGTHGYMAPEYAMRGILTEKADVYSFGVVALEVISGKSNAEYKPNQESIFLLDTVSQCE
ncbi:hypothetical protein HHK36_003354 [Tetracentron sinense]|uniref:non-specific serine/threonine protein kinase n=1 Tax=Tetracentron sinense TaxID=13715 RepID=A0A834ZR06_TETSI|nr:hypothetical protein HHK36_003354 [Tetracentron sinense]